ncbi:unnamed protein product [Penicillium olsonii]|nr:unnamed protein product [Penicillium olsonii]CAG7926145.1 unnamed protein product [Penicillium olsonii]
MAARKHDLLDLSGSEEEVDRGYDSEDAAESKGRAVKRRRTADNQDPFGFGSDEEESDNDEEEESRPKGKGRKQTKTQDAEEDEDEDEDEEMDDEEDGGASLDTADSSKPKNKLLNKKLAKLTSGKPPKKDKSGVVYLSSLPPYLKPFALKNMLEKRNFGPITKVFLAPLLPSAAGQKQKSNKRKLYTDGWVEFKTAKLCAETLNARTIGGLKSSWYRDDLWNMKYLKGYKWANLMEQIQMERATREATQRMADQKAKREDKVYLSGVESGRIADGMKKKEEEKLKRRLEEQDGEVKQTQKPARKIRRTFEQSKAVKSDGKLADDTQRVLGKIF